MSAGDKGVRPSDGTDAGAMPVFATERRVMGLPVSRWPAIIAPIVIGAVEAPAAVAGEGASMMREAPRLRNPSVSRLGDDVLFEGIPIWSATPAEPDPAPDDASDDESEG